MFFRFKKSFSIPTSTKGFTLIEILVVISIIALLTAIGMLALNSARVNARNARRKGDIAEVRKALEIYYHDSSNDSYPNGGSVGSPNNESDIQDLAAFLIPTYLVKLPDDPLKRLKNYQYVWKNSGQDYGVLVPFANDKGQDCMFKTPGGSSNWFKVGSVTVPDCNY